MAASRGVAGEPAGEHTRQTQNGHVRKRWGLGEYPRPPCMRYIGFWSLKRPRRKLLPAWAGPMPLSRKRSQRTH